MRYESFSLPSAFGEIKLEAFLLDPSPEIESDALKPAVIICPGGGYMFRSDREAEPIAMRYLAAGVHALILHYSVAPARWPTAALELARAVRMTRRHAKEWSILPDSIFVTGFSAGGHLCCSLGTLWDEPVFHEALGGEADWRPDGMILCYPVITLGALTHEGSRDALLGEGAPLEMIDQLSLEKRVTPGTVPAFLWHTQADNAVPVENSLRYACALREDGVPFELHVYENGVHGLSLCDERTAGEAKLLEPDDAGWIQLATRWLRRHSGRR